MPACRQRACCSGSPRQSAANLRTRYPPLPAAELRRIAPPRDEAPSAAGLRTECAVLTSWTGSLTMQMLSTLLAARQRPSRQLAA